MRPRHPAKKNTFSLEVYRIDMARRNTHLAKLDALLNLKVIYGAGIDGAPEAVLPILPRPGSAARR
jgi:hypothetical protein